MANVEKVVTVLSSIHSKDEREAFLGCVCAYLAASATDSVVDLAIADALKHYRQVDYEVRTEHQAQTS